MAVYKRSYHGYDGPQTSEWSRFAIIPRYAYRGLFQSKIMTAFFVLCFVPPSLVGRLKDLFQRDGAQS